MTSTAVAGGVREAPDGEAASSAAAGPAGLFALARRSLRDGVATLEVDALSGDEAAELFSDLAEITRQVASARFSLISRLESSKVFRQRGYRNAAAMIADLEKTGVGEANGTVRTARRLRKCPKTAGALATGKISESQAKVIAGAADVAPGAEDSLLDGAGELSAEELATRCLRAKAAVATADPMDAYRRIHADRHLKHWTDEEGGVRLRGRLTPDAGARVIAALEDATRELVDEARRAGREEPAAAHRADALCGLILGGGTGGPGGPGGTGGTGDPDGTGGPRAPRTVVHVRIDHEALLRGHPEGTELSEITGVGPVPVPVVRSLMTDAGVRAIFCHGTEISRIYHFTRTINEHLRTALVERDPCCVVPGCGADKFLEIDHVVPFAEGGPTTLSNLARLCWFHHHLKTDEGYELTRDDDRWHFAKPPPFGQEPGLGVDTPEGRARQAEIIEDLQRERTKPGEPPNRDGPA